MGEEVRSVGWVGGTLDQRGGKHTAPIDNEASGEVIKCAERGVFENKMEITQRR